MLVFFRMGRIFKSFLFSIVALFGAAQLIEGFSFNNDLATLVMAAVVFGIVNSFLKPILKLVTLPFNIATFGLFSSIINIILLYITINVVPGLSIAAFTIPPLEIKLPLVYSPLTRSLQLISLSWVLSFLPQL